MRGGRASLEGTACEEERTAPEARTATSSVDEFAARRTALGRDRVRHHKTDRERVIHRGARAAVASRGRGLTGQVDADCGTTMERLHTRTKRPPRSARSRRFRRDSRVEVIGFEPTASSLRTKPQPHGVHGADVQYGLSSAQIRRFRATPPDALPSCNTATYGRLRQIPAPHCGAAVEQTHPLDRPRSAGEDWRSTVGPMRGMRCDRANSVTEVHDGVRPGHRRA
jgi:hypothetical protein